MSDPLDDLLGGGAEKPAPKRSLRTKVVKGRTLKPEAVEGKEVKDDLPISTEFMRPVGISFIADVAGKQPQQIRKRLAKCPVVGYHKAQGKDHPLYDFMTAMSYLLEPKGNIEDWFASKNAATLPPYVNKMFWDSAHQRNRVMRESGDLWHSDDVVTALGRVALTIKEESNLWIEDLPERDLLTDAQYKALRDAVHRLQDTIRTSMIEMPDHFKTHAMSETIRDELAEGGRLPDDQIGELD